MNKIINQLVDAIVTIIFKKIASAIECGDLTTQKQPF